MNKKLLRLSVLSLWLVVQVGCGSDSQTTEQANGAGAAGAIENYRLLEGSTMGTYYRVQYRQT